LNGTHRYPGGLVLELFFYLCPPDKDTDETVQPLAPTVICLNSKAIYNSIIF
jgi:hypothetical protein